MPLPVNFTVTPLLLVQAGLVALLLCYTVVIVNIILSYIPIGQIESSNFQESKCCH